MSSLQEFVRNHLENAASYWSLGTFGAIAEFIRGPEEPADFSKNGGVLSSVTARGALRFDSLAGVRAVASETASSRGWSHRVAFCLPREVCAMGRRSVITELGPDTGALRAEDRSAILFDLGLDVLQADLCIRTDDPRLITVLRDEAGRSIFDPARRAFTAIHAASPHRVFDCRFGRIEVFQAIPPAHRISPEGPHTHVLPKLLRHRLTHAATEPIPDGWVPCAHLYPPHPTKDALGKPRTLDRDSHDAFQEILRRYGDSALVDVKSSVFVALDKGADPFAVAIPDNRHARNVQRVAIQQWCALTDRSPDEFEMTRRKIKKRPFPESRDGIGASLQTW